MRCLAQVLVLEYLRGGQLFDHLHKLGDHYNEQQAADLFAQARAAFLLVWDVSAITSA